MPSEWIKTAERLPEVDVAVLVWVWGYDIEIAYRDRDGDWLGPEWTSRVRDEHVTHWMPLPAPPEA